MMMKEKERKCKDMADVCELAHERTVRECKRKHIKVDTKICDKENPDLCDETHYTPKAQDIFDKHYDYICEITGI